MTDIVEETEPESSFKETLKKKPPVLGRKKSSVPKTVPEEEDRDDDFSDESEDEQTKTKKNELKDFTFIPGKEKGDNHGHTFMDKSLNDADLSKLSSVERIREYLEEEIGIDLLLKIHPVLKSFGDDILLAEKMVELKQSLKPYLSGDKVDRYHQYFATLIFYELEMEKSVQNKRSDQQPEQYDASGMMNVINCFKDVSTTAAFGKQGLMGTIGKR